MGDQEKTKEQLIIELTEQRQKNAEFEKMKTIWIMSEQNRKLAIEILSLLNRVASKKKLIYEILSLIKDFTKFEAAGIRLREGEDFPYYETIGFPARFVEAEKYLCARDQAEVTSGRRGLSGYRL